MQDDNGLFQYAVKRNGEAHIIRTVDKFRIDLEHLAQLMRQYRDNKQILEYWKMLNLDLDTKVNEWVNNHGGLAGLASGKKETIDGVVKEFKDFFVENAKSWAEAAKKQEEAAKNRRKYIYQAFNELGHHVPEGDLVTGVIALSGVPLKEHAAQKDAIKAELDTMGEEQKVAWVIDGGSGLVLLETEKGEDTDEAATWAKKTQNFRPLRGRAAANAPKARR